MTRYTMPIYADLSTLLTLDRVFEASSMNNEGYAKMCEKELHVTPPSFSNKINHPAHYTKHPSGVECITIVEHMGFNLGNAVKYIWRADLKENALEDLKKALWYISREIAKREAETNE
jgi:Protein of unknwon function (DUF3310)